MLASKLVMCREYKVACRNWCC